MATKAIVSDDQPVSEELEDFRAVQKRLLAGAAECIHADVQRLIELGVIANKETASRKSGQQTCSRVPSATSEVS